MESGSRLKPACQEAELSLRTYRRWSVEGVVQQDKRPDAKRPVPMNKLSADETEEIVAVCNEPLFASLPPSQIVPKLADQGRYIASESSFYRILKDKDQLHHRGRTRTVEKRSAPTSYTATGPNQVWCWDITYGVFQGSWHSFLNFYAAVSTASFFSFSGFSSTAGIWSQFRVSPDQRVGFLPLAAW